MDPQSFLLTVGQVGIALAGFSALISSFRRSDVALTATELAGRSMILEMGLAATFFALIPFPIESILGLLGFNTGVWRISSALILTFLLAWAVYNFSRFTQISQREGANVFNMVYNVLLAIVSAFLALNIFFYGSTSFYMIALIWMLMVAGVQFLVFVYRYAQQDN
ncbi:MAG: hypothetical protein U0670_17960 [Anaerolineae bacterium]